MALSAWTIARSVRQAAVTAESTRRTRQTRNLAGHVLILAGNTRAPMAVNAAKTRLENGLACARRLRRWCHGCAVIPRRNADGCSRACGAVHAFTAALMRLRRD